MRLNRRDAMRPRPHGQAKLKGWLPELMEILKRHSRMGARGRPVSDETQDKYHDHLVLAFRTLRRLGYKIQNPMNLSRKHVIALIRHWESLGLSASSLQGRISTLRTFTRWIGKPDMIQDSASLVAYQESVKRTYAAQHDKSWSAHDIDIGLRLREIYAEDRFVGMQLEMQLAFGLRRKEACRIRPHLSDQGCYLAVHLGTKGGRHRTVPIQNAYQRDVLARAKAMVGRLNGHLGQPNATLSQSLRRYDYVVGKIGLTKAALGVTGHGLRAQYLNDRSEQLGMVAAVRGGKGDQMPRECIQYIRQIIAEEAGHGRPYIATAYSGSFGRLPRRQEKYSPLTETRSPPDGAGKEGGLPEGQDSE